MIEKFEVDISKARQSRRYAENPRDTAVSEASAHHEDFFEKTKNSFLDKVNGSMGAKFQVCIGFRLDRRSITDKPTLIRGKKGIF